MAKPAELSGNDAPSLLTRAVGLYAKREDKEALENAIKTCEEALKAADTDDAKTRASINVELAKYHFKLGFHHETAKKKKLAAFSKGEEYAKEAIEKDPENAGGYYWKAVNFGEWCNTKTFGSIAFLKGRSEFEDAFKKVITLEPSYENWGADRALGEYNFLAPWGDKEMALEHIDRAVNSAPGYLWNLMVQAEVYKKVDKAKSRDLLQSILNKDIDRLSKDVRFENEYVQEKVRGME